jgi:flavin reductase (DIM6/NTAB) family NADH-FMN oxidoreductase RutF
MAKKKMGARHFMFPQPAVIVGANVDGKPNYLTVAWTGVMQHSPALIYVSVRRERYSRGGIEANGTFSVNIPSTHLVVETDYVGINSGHKVDKSKVFDTFYGSLETAPMIEECPVNMECKLIKAIDFEGTHIVYVGEVVESFVSEECLTDGAPDVEKIDPLIFSTEGRYWGIGRMVAKAFNVGKGFEKKDAEK